MSLIPPRGSSRRKIKLTRNDLHGRPLHFPRIFRLETNWSSLLNNKSARTDRLPSPFLFSLKKKRKGKEQGEEKEKRKKRREKIKEGEKRRWFSRYEINSRGLSARAPHGNLASCAFFLRFPPRRWIRERLISELVT